MRKVCGLGTIALFLSLAGAARAQTGPVRPGSYEVHVTDEKTFVYEQPSQDSAAIRRLFLGELVTLAGEVIGADQVRWWRIQLGTERFGYVRAEKLGAPQTKAPTPWKAPVIIRDERPLSIGVKGWGETLGVGLNLRYQPFTRLGVSLNFGGLIDRNSTKGTVYGISLYSCFILRNFSPVVEVGLSSAGYNSGASTLALINLNVAAGLEYMFDWGGFAMVYGTYLRSVHSSVSFGYADAMLGNTEVGDFGALSLKGNRVFESVRPGLMIGYAF